MNSSTPKKMKASDRQAVVRKVMTLLKKRYGRAAPRQSRPVLETLLFAACLENSSYDKAEAALGQLMKSFHDLNEVRVSSISEIESVLSDLPAPEWRALRVREILQFTFEKYYSFDLEPIKRKTIELAEKQLGKIRYLTPFMRLYVLQNCLGSHVVPVDDMTREVLQWLGLVPLRADNEAAAEDMKSALKKQDSLLLCSLLRSLATDKRYAGTFQPAAAAGRAGEADAATAGERLRQHLARPPRPAKAAVKKARKKPTVVKRPAKKVRKSGAAPLRKKVSKPKKSRGKRAGAT